MWVFCNRLGIYNRREHFLLLRRKTSEVVFFDLVDEVAKACTTLVAGCSGEPDEKFFLGIACPSLLHKADVFSDGNLLFLGQCVGNQLNRAGDHVGGLKVR